MSACWTAICNKDVYTVDHSKMLDLTQLQFATLDYYLFTSYNGMNLELPSLTLYSSNLDLWSAYNTNIAAVWKAWIILSICQAVVSWKPTLNMLQTNQQVGFKTPALNKYHLHRISWQKVSHNMSIGLIFMTQTLGSLKEHNSIPYSCNVDELNVV